MSAIPPKYDAAVVVIESTKGLWPWKAVDEHRGAWCEISNEHFDYCLNVLPPIYFPGGFATSEAVRFDCAEDDELYLSVVTWRGRRFACLLSPRQMKTAGTTLHAYLDASNEDAKRAAGVPV